MEAGKNNKGVAIPKEHTAKEVNVWQMHSIPPPGDVPKVGSNGKDVVLCPSEPTTEKTVESSCSIEKKQNGKLEAFKLGFASVGTIHGKWLTSLENFRPIFHGFP